jgi:hypothetical protein
MNWSHITIEILALVFLIAWCLWAVNWKNTWPVLAVGGWAPFVLVLLMAAKVWSLIDRRPLTVAGVTLHNYWWQLIATVILAGIVLFCGYLQGQMGFEPATVSLEPPVHDNGHDDHGHGHH